VVSASVAAGSKPGTTTKTYRKILRKVAPAAEGDAAVTKALTMYGSIVEELNQAYDRGNMEDGSHIALARLIMFELNHEAETLAAKGIRIPFFHVVAGGGNKRAKRRWGAKGMQGDDFNVLTRSDVTPRTSPFPCISSRPGFVSRLRFDSVHLSQV
jgi:hypothetical protein